ARLVAGHAMLRHVLLCLIRGPVDHDEEDAIAPDDWAGLIVVELGLAVGAGQRDFPEDVLVVLAAPGEWQVLFLAGAFAAGAAPAGPIARVACWWREKEQGERQAEREVPPHGDPRKAGRIRAGRRVERFRSLTLPDRLEPFRCLIAPGYSLFSQSFFIFCLAS